MKLSELEIRAELWDAAIF